MSGAFSYNMKTYVKITIEIDEQDLAKLREGLQKMSPEALEQMLTQLKDVLEQHRKDWSSSGPIPP